MKIECRISYPWATIPDDVEIVEMEDDATKKEIEEFALNCIEDMIWNRIGYDWRVLDAEE